MALNEDLFERIGNEFAFKFRISNMYMNEGEPYYLHSPFPTKPNSVFFGPDTYLYLEYLKSVSIAPRTVVDVCCGGGAGAIHIARQFPNAKVTGLDLNAEALKLARVNAHMTGVQVEFVESDLFERSPNAVELIVSNTPYIAGAEGVALYADGGSSGLELSLRIVDQGMKRLVSGGLLVIYTGVGIPLSGQDPFREHLRTWDLLDYRVLHPDMWPEEMERKEYANVGRIQVVGATIRKP